jgi:polyene glycosyltransferase
LALLRSTQEYIFYAATMECMDDSGRPILFASTAHAGQLNPLLSIAGELSRRGVSGLWFASTDKRRGDIEGAAAGSPIHFVSSGVNDRSKELVEELVEDPAVYDAYAHRGPLTTNSAQLTLRWMLNPKRLAVEYQRMLVHIDQLQPCLMVVNATTIGALDAAMTRRIPFILSVPFTPSALFVERLPWDYPVTGSGLPRQMSAAQKLANLWYRLRLQTVLVTRFPYFSFAWRRKAMGMANAFASLARYSDAATAIFCYSVFGLEYPFPVPPHLHLLGTMVPSPTPATQGGKDELSQWLDSHSTVIYVGLGTLVQLSELQITTLLTAFKRLGPNVYILWKLPNCQQALLPPGEVLPTNLRIEHWIPSQLGVLAHPNVRVFVTHGGSNGFHEGIYFGKPLLVMPFWLDCFDFAVRAVDSGVGLALDWAPIFTGEEVAVKLERLLTDGRFRVRAQYWGEQLQKAGGVCRAADLILASCPVDTNKGPKRGNGALA